MNLEDIVGSKERLQTPSPLSGSVTVSSRTTNHSRVAFPKFRMSHHLRRFCNNLKYFIPVVFFFNLYFWTSQNTTFSSTFGSPPFSKFSFSQKLKVRVFHFHKKWKWFQFDLYCCYPIICVSVWRGLDAESTSNKCFKIYYQPLHCSRRTLGTDQKVK